MPIRATAMAAPLIAALALVALPVAAQTWPAKPVRIIVPFGTGGPADIFARILGQHLQGALGQPFVVEARPGAGSIIGTEIAAKSAPDGYTLLMMSNTHTVNESLVPKKPFVLMKDFVPVAPVNFSDLLLVVHPSVPARSVKELVALAKKAKGGMNYASSGTGTPYHMAGELFKTLAGVDIVHVPHKTSGEARTSVMSGQTEMMLDAITTMAPVARAGRVRALGSSGRERSSVMPDVPTIAEAGVQGYETTIWLGLMAPAGTPQPVLERLNAEITKVVNRPDVRENWAKQGATPLTMTIPQFEKYLNADIAKWAKVVKLSGARTDQ
ncbi:MAG TPA: tripartite tricarboxylate transporter substrate binding protein [Burkholderiales bacterium]|nr:tripartite tricarboxylate transporter substrate binding protein [Burkholderiales bacterium]